ncbi:MAG: hypothetical protein K8L99_15265 [Anaerolineae bacterium]|nr:hypothetical protein [Anaerolineae bacterium]
MNVKQAGWLDELQSFETMDAARKGLKSLVKQFHADVPAWYPMAVTFFEGRGGIRGLLHPHSMADREHISKMVERDGFVVLETIGEKAL